MKRTTVTLLAAITVLVALNGSAKAVLPPPPSSITIATVPVGNVGNTADSTTYGAVSYVYNIGKYEVTAGQYKDFLNAVAKTDTYGLYNTTMSRTDYGSGITRSGSSGTYVYAVADAFINRPVNYVSYWDACRFANWLGNGQGSSSTETGAYTLTSSGIADNTITRNATATWAVTSEDEWYKAAYYKGSGTNTGYWTYPTKSDVAPGQDMTDAFGNNANYYTSPYAWPIDSDKYTTVVGEFQDSASPYGTFDQGGNVWEWNEAISGSYRGLRGGSFDFDVDNLQAAYRSDNYPPDELSSVGFRVSQIPEPATMSLLALGGIATLIRRRRA